MPTIAGWITGEQVPQETIAETLNSMGEVLARHGGQPASMVEPGIGLIAFSDPAYAMHQNDEPPVLDLVPDRRTLVYHRPLSGMHPLYYVNNWPAEGNILFASEIKALLSVGVPRRLHLAALDALLRYGFIPAPWTVFQDISVVPAGSILRWQRAKTVLNHASDYRLDDPFPQADLLEHSLEILEDATRNLLPPHDDIVALTGGSRSSALATLLAAQHTNSPFHVATLGYKNSLRARIWREAERIADACQRPFLAVTGVDQAEFWIAALVASETPAIDTRNLAIHQLLHSVSEETGARVAMSGLGGHMLSNGSLHAVAATASSPVDEHNVLKQYQLNLRKQRLALTNAGSQLWSQEAIARLREEEAWEKTLHARKLARQAAKFSNQAQSCFYLDAHLRMPDLLVGPFQQLATQEHIAVRSPFLHPDVIDMLTRLPTTLEDGTAKSHLVSALVERYLPGPQAVSTQPLSSPTESLLKIDSSEILQQTLSASAIRSAGIFDTEKVEELIKQREDANSRCALIWVFTTQLLCQLFGVTL
jgi:asparagine synthetase B (glutamine-hydrolysing)